MNIYIIISNNIIKRKIIYKTLNNDLGNKQNILGIGVYTGNIDFVGSGSTADLPSAGSVCWIQHSVASGSQPDAEYYILETFPVMQGTILQRATQFISNGSPIVFTRMFLNEQWNPWGRLN